MKTRQGKDYRYRKMGTKETIPPMEKGQKPITFHAGGLHQKLGVPQGTKIPAEKMKNALDGLYGPEAKKEAEFKHNVLKGKR